MSVQVELADENSDRRFPSKVDIKTNYFHLRQAKSADLFSVRSEHEKTLRYKFKCLLQVFLLPFTLLSKMQVLHFHNCCSSRL